jgi:hypothetical protein
MVMSQRRLRARPTGFTSPLTRRPVFRIEDETGHVLRRISTARHAEEAMAFFWRAASLPGLQRFAIAQGGHGPGTDAMLNAARLPLPGPQGQSLPLIEDEAGPVAPGDDRPADDDAPAVRPRRRRRVGTGPGKQGQDDLFVAPEAVADAAQAAAPHGEAAPEPLVVSPMAPPEASPTPVAAPRTSVADALPAAEPPPMLLPEMAMLRTVNPRDFRPNDRPDAYLYHITTRPDADTALEAGLPLSAADPVILTERGGVSYWLSVLSEDFDYILDQPPELVVLRLRRQAVQDLLEPDPSGSDDPRRATYLLTGHHG